MCRSFLGLGLAQCLLGRSDTCVVLVKVFKLKLLRFPIVFENEQCRSDVSIHQADKRRGPAAKPIIELADVARVVHYLIFQSSGGYCLWLRWFDSFSAHLCPTGTPAALHKQ